MRRLRRSPYLLTLVVLAIFATSAVAAGHKDGWEVKRTVSDGAYTGIDSAKHCGASRFGTYTVYLVDRYTSGVLKGKTARIAVTFALLDDHRRHRFRFVSVTGTAVQGVAPADLHAIDQALAARFSQFSIEIVDVLPGAHLKTCLWLTGKLVSTGVVELKRTRC